MKIKNDKYITVGKAVVGEDYEIVTKVSAMFEKRKEALEGCANNSDMIKCKVVRKKVKNQNYYFNEYNRLKKKPSV